MLHSVKIRFDPAEDRLEWVIRVVDEGAYRFHLTRRLAVKLASQLQILAAWSAAVPESVDAATRRSITSSHHSAIAAQAAFSKEPAGEKPTRLHTGDRPALLTDVKCGKRTQDDRWLLSFNYGQDEVLSLILQQATLHGVIELLRRKLKQADWGLNLLAEPVAGTAAEQTARQMH